jgi:hypothetical protein
MGISPAAVEERASAGQHVVDPDGRTIAEVPSAPQNARRRRQERRDSYLPGKPSLEREQPVSSCLCFLGSQHHAG